MPVTIHQPVAGLAVGESYSGPLEPWLVVNGYAADGVLKDKSNLTGALPEQDPTLAENREPAGESEPVVLGEALEVKDNAVEDDENPKPLPGKRNRTVGADEDPAVQAQTDELDGRVNPDEVEPATQPPAPPKRTRTVK